jgi:hypothetical protein
LAHHTYTVAPFSHWTNVFSSAAELCSSPNEYINMSNLV